MDRQSIKSTFMYFLFLIALICTTVLSVPTDFNSTYPTVFKSKSASELKNDTDSLITYFQTEQLSRFRFGPSLRNVDFSQKYSAGPSKAQTNLENISEMLMIFLKKRPFDVAGFQYQARKLQRELLEIRLSPLVRTSESFSKQFNFAAGVLQTLIQFAHTLNLYESSQNIRHTLIKKVIHTHILVLSLQNIYGELDLDYIGCKNDIRSLQDFIKILETQYPKSELPLSLENEFNDRLAELGKILHTLALQIPVNSLGSETKNRELK